MDDENASVSDDNDSTTSVLTDDATSDDNGTVLTDTGDAGATDDSSTEDAAANVAAAQAILDSGDSSDEDKAAAKAIVDAAAEDAGSEGSQTPPDTYADFDMPKGIIIDEAALAQATPLFKELGLTQEQSQKVIDLYAGQVQAGSQKQVDDFNRLMSDWRTKSANDKEFGGDKFEENVKIAQSAIGKYGTPELKQLLEEHGVGNHPEVIRFMVKVGQTLKEDIPGTTGAVTTGAVTTKAEDRVNILYPKTKDT